MKVPFEYQPWFEVIVNHCPDGKSEMDKWMERCIQGDWTIDWTHGEYRSAPEAERKSTRYLVRDKDEAALCHIYWC